MTLKIIKIFFFKYFLNERSTKMIYRRIATVGQFGKISTNKSLFLYQNYQHLA